MKKVVLIFSLFLLQYCVAQSRLQTVSIGDFKTISGNTIKDCKIGYSTIGTLNADKSNIIVWLTWFTGTSDYISKNMVSSYLDTSRYYVIVIDALGNGVSSSPSNTKNCPAITIQDMVNSQYILLTRELKINHIYAAVGMCMGGMQSLEWAVDYPEFIDNVVSLSGTPKASYYDTLLLKTQLEMLKFGEKAKNKEDIMFARKRLAEIDLMHLLTPAYLEKNHVNDDQNTYLTDNLSDMRVQVEAMLLHSIYKNANESEIKSKIKAKVLLTVESKDLMVNPLPSIQLSQQLSCKLITYNHDCGQGFLNCEDANDRMKESINQHFNYK